LKRAEECLSEFKNEIDKHKVDKILAMATSAARDAKNGDQLFAIGKKLNIPIQIIPGSDEARITYQGATVSTVSTVGSVGTTDVAENHKTSVIIDIGGGSTELIQGRGTDILFSQSLDIGGVRLTEKMISAQPVPVDEQNKADAFIKEQLRPVLARISQHKVDQAIAVAGTPTALAAIEFGGFDEKKIDGHFISREQLRKWVQEFAATSVEFKREKYNLGGRADIIYIGVLILLNIIEGLGLPGFYVSTKGVRYGVALEMLRNPAL
jgi:exopolyphosphatase/guanosine-5'-triphosphate,3'-diphosphate pyrophosphatase